MMRSSSAWAGGKTANQHRAGRRKGLPVPRVMETTGNPGRGASSLHLEHRSLDTAGRVLRGVNGRKSQQEEVGPPMVHSAH